MHRPIREKSRRGKKRLVLVAAVACLVPAGAAFAQGIRDQVNDPPPTAGYSCPSSSTFQSFTPSRRLLAALELRLRFFREFPSGGATLQVRVRRASIDGPVVGASTTFVTPTSSGGSTLVHFDFTPPAVLDPAGEYLIEWLNPPPGQADWAGSDTRPGAATYGGGNAWLCGGLGLPTARYDAIDLNFITYTPADSAPPETTFAIPPPTSLAPHRGTAVSFVFEGSDDLSYPENLKYECALDAGPFAPCDGSFDSNTSRDGLHRFRARAVDESGAVDPTPATAAWITDNTAPTVRVVQQAAGGSALSFAIAAADNIDVKRQLTLFASIDSSRYVRCSSTLRIAKSRHPHRVRVVAVDRAGNRSRAALVVVRKE